MLGLNRLDYLFQVYHHPFLRECCIISTLAPFANLVTRGRVWYRMYSCQPTVGLVVSNWKNIFSNTQTANSTVD